MLQGLWAGSIQNMHPKLGAAVWIIPTSSASGGND